MQGSGVTFYNNKEYYWKKNDIINLTETSENIKHYAYNKETILLYISNNVINNTNSIYNTELDSVITSSFGG